MERTFWGLFRRVRIPSRGGDVLRSETGMVSRTESRYRESIIATLRSTCSRTAGGGIMFKRSRLQVNRVLENAEKTSEVGLGSELGCNPDDLRVELAGYWSRLLVRVKEQSEVVDEKNLPEEIKP